MSYTGSECGFTSLQYSHWCWFSVAFVSKMWHLWKIVCQAPTFLDTVLWLHFDWHVNQESSTKTNKIVVNEAVTDTSPNCWAEGPSDLLDTITIFPKSGLEELKIIMEAFLVTHSSASMHQHWKNSLYAGGMMMWSIVQVEVSVSWFSVDYMVQGAIPSPVYIDAKKG